MTDNPDSLASAREARKDYPVVADCAHDLNSRQFGQVLDEIDQLRRWKHEAIQVLAQLDAVWETAGRPGRLGYSKSAAVQDEIARLRARHAIDEVLG